MRKSVGFFAALTALAVLALPMHVARAQCVQQQITATRITTDTVRVEQAEVTLCRVRQLPQAGIAESLLAVGMTQQVIMTVLARVVAAAEKPMAEYHYNMMALHTSRHFMLKPLCPITAQPEPVCRAPVPPLLVAMH
ncbi:hypothetical protein K8R03_02280 [Candidatus Kaiserbacteria bacterium]|nr:hypothetical protein [Candidatus Kaiserbacteria bacterium]